MNKWMSSWLNDRVHDWMNEFINKSTSFRSGWVAISGSGRNLWWRLPAFGRFHSRLAVSTLVWRLQGSNGHFFVDDPHFCDYVMAVECSLSVSVCLCVHVCVNHWYLVNFSPIVLKFCQSTSNVLVSCGYNRHYDSSIFRPTSLCNIVVVWIGSVQFT